MYERPLRVALALCALLPSCAVAAQPSEDDDGPKGWKELELRLPPYPKQGDLIEFEAGAASTNRFFIDAASISVGSDGVVRYTLVAKGEGGAENVSYEGIRCAAAQYKSYAFGRRDGTWSPSRLSEWRKIEYKHFNRQHGVLYANYLCYDRILVSAKEVVQRFKYGTPSRTGKGE